MATERDPLLPRPPPEDDELKPKTPTELGPLQISRWNRRSILCGIWLANFLGALNSTLVPTMMPAISSEFQRFHQAAWLGTAYLLATCTFTPLYGRLCNVLGRRRANHTALLFSAFGAIGCGLSQNMEMLIAARFIAGMGSGGLFTTASIIVSDMYTLRDRGLVQGAASCFNALGTGLGGVFGGIIADWLGWRAAFLLQLPLFFVSFLLTSRSLRYVTSGKSKSAKEILRRIDYWGSLTLFVSLGSLLLFLSMRYNEMLNASWSDPWVFIPLLCGIAFITLFFLVESFVASDPVLSPSMLRQRVPALIGVSNFLSATCNFSVSYFFPVWFQTVMLESASTAGLHITPNSVAASLGSVFAGVMMHWTGRYKVVNIVFGCFPFFGAVMLSRMSMSSGSLQSWLSIVPLGFGNAVVMQTNLIALLAHLHESQTAVGTGFGALFRGMGQVGGVAISSAIFQTRLDAALTERIHSEDAVEASSTRQRACSNCKQIIDKIRRSSNIIRDLPPVVQLAARESYADSLRVVFQFAAGATLLAYIARLPIPDRDLDKAYSQRCSQPRDTNETSGSAV
ncbi:Vacuolar amino acid permease [Mycena indigotica]|uniref:Vacuolar amino acid permease n=1 Tax=Mycena indigotica TaxID=2126181 RepID=A0A8H6TFT6_9AGAR|nr:Vacuolar amino acid permease [Mycena indigotica]KAF7314965.1 Vacuolar amino acid permease [Mycena indigotica]